MNQPTVGRIVHFVIDEHTAKQFNDCKDGNSVQAGEVLPAVIVRTWGGTCVNLRVLRDAGTDGWVTSVAQEDETCATRCWRWPLLTK